MPTKAMITLAAGGFCESGNSGEDSQARRRDWREVRTPTVGGRAADTGVAFSLQATLLYAVRYERRADIHEAFLVLCCALICLSYLRHRF
jgi:hypothetical protein